MFGEYIRAWSSSAALYRTRRFCLFIFVFTLVIAPWWGADQLGRGHTRLRIQKPGRTRRCMGFPASAFRQAMARQKSKNPDFSRRRRGGQEGAKRHPLRRRICAQQRQVLQGSAFALTGELWCLHLEWRLRALRAVRAVGIESGRDLVGFNHRDFWRKRLLLFDVDRQRLGRLIRNSNTGRRGRTPEIVQSGRYRVDISGRTGEVYVRAHDTIQELVDQLKSSYRVHRALVQISRIGMGDRMGDLAWYITERCRRAPFLWSSAG